MILSSGAVESPKLLMLSGIGAEANLTELGVIPRVNLPGVGQNLQDHLYSFVRIDNKRGLSGYGRNVFDAANPLNFLRLLASGGGPLADTGIPFMALLNVNGEETGDKRPDIQLKMASQDLDVDYGLKFASLLGLDNNNYDSLYGQVPSR